MWDKIGGVWQVKPSYLRRRLARLIETAFKAQFDMVVRVDPLDLIAATGAWRTNQNLDVYRWEGSGHWLPAGCTGDGVLISIDSWVPMTQLVRHGIRHGLSLSHDYATSYEVWEGKGRT